MRLTCNNKAYLVEVLTVRNKDLKPMFRSQGKEIASRTTRWTPTYQWTLMMKIKMLGIRMTTLFSGSLIK